MDNKVTMWLTSNAKYFDPSVLPMIKSKLEKLDDDKFFAVTACELKDPTALLLISIFLGSLGIDRFMLGDTGMGVLKLLTGGCCGILTIVDWFTVTKKTKEKNFATISMYL